MGSIQLSVLGYLKYRRTEAHQLSLRDKAVALSLKIYLERKQAMASPSPFDSHQGSAISKDDISTSSTPLPVSVALFTAKTNENMSTHDYDYTLWSVGDDERYTSATKILLYEI